MYFFLLAFSTSSSAQKEYRTEVQLMCWKKPWGTMCPRYR